MSFINRVLSSRPAIAPLLLRIPVGIIFIGHGSQKLFGWFGGYGLEGTAHWMASIGLTPGIVMATLSGSAEFFGGLCIFLGLLTRPAAAVVCFTMLVAIFSVHISHGLFLAHHGFEYALALAAVCASLVASGSGHCGIDKILSKRV
ncbi:MAG: Putative oxidoreductase MhqP [Candidatus Celerinatantimonas neptuna]|nr:MAG: Putative oxidoreductase MhqP [Candidatus Celerinatantimonas neptuna]